MARKRRVKSPSSEKKESDIPEKTRLDLELASPVAAIVQFLNILADECSARRSVEGYTDLGKVRVENNISEIEIGVTEDKKVFNVLIRFVLKVHRTESGKETTEPTVEMSCRFVLIYFLKSMEGIDEANLIAFGRTSGVFSAWPYWREFVHSTSLRLGVPSLVLPTFRI